MRRRVNSIVVQRRKILSAKDLRLVVDSIFAVGGGAKQHVIDGLLITTGEGAQCFRQDEGDEEVGDGQQELLLLAAQL